MRLLIAAAAAGIVWLVVAASATAAVITVNTDDDDGTLGDCELREAITAANDNVATDTCAAGEAGPIRDVIDFDIGADNSVQTISPGTRAADHRQRPARDRRPQRRGGATVFADRNRCRRSRRTQC